MNGPFTAVARLAATGVLLAGIGVIAGCELSNDAGDVATPEAESVVADGRDQDKTAGAFSMPSLPSPSTILRRRRT